MSSDASTWEWDSEASIFPQLDFSVPLYDIPQDTTPASPAIWQAISFPHSLYISSYGDDPHKVNCAIIPSEMSSIAHSFLENEGAWIIPRQNKIEIQCRLDGEITTLTDSGSAFLLAADGVLSPIADLFLSIDAIRVIDGKVFSERAPLFLQNSQKIMVMPEAVQIFPKLQNADWTASWSKLQFITTTVGNASKPGPSERFHIIISLVGYTIQGDSTMAVTIHSIQSPPIMVIGQNPARFIRSKKKQGRKETATRPTIRTSPISPVSSVSPVSPSSVSSDDGLPPAKRKRGDQVLASNPFIFEEGKVGINCKPYETLSIGGNLFYTGDLIKPSDRQIKRNIIPLQVGHLDNLSKMTLYQYERMNLADTGVRFIPERGVIAQEVKQVLPTAVTTIGKTQLLDGSVIDLMAVNHQDLLLETIGATQELNNYTTNLIERVETLSEESLHRQSLLQNLSSALELLQKSEQNMVYENESCFTRINIFSSRLPRQIAGIVSLILLTLLMLNCIFYWLRFHDWMIILFILVSFWAWGIKVVICTIAITCVKRRKRRARENV